MITADPTSALNNPAVLELYRKLISAWNRREATDFSACFEDASSVVGFDGSQMDGRAAIESTLAAIFRDHKTARYVAIVRAIRALGQDTALLRAVVGMVPEGRNEINPAVNAIQSLVAIKVNGDWRIALFQNTPAAFHGRPELSQALTQELQAAYDSSR